MLVGTMRKVVECLAVFMRDATRTNLDGTKTTVYDTCNHKVIRSRRRKHMKRVTQSSESAVVDSFRTA